MFLAVLVVVGTVGATSWAQNNESAPNGISAASLPYGAQQVLRLQQAQVGEETIIAYIKNNPLYYALDANQIIYLRQQGISNAIITTMLNQPKTPPVSEASTPAQPSAPAPAAPAPAPAPVTTVVSPTVTYLQSVPSPVYYYQPYYYPSYPSYGIYPALSLSFAWGSGYHGGGYGGWHGGYYGGYHGGYGGWHH